MANIIWRNPTKGTLTWEVIVNFVPQEGPLASGQTKTMDRTGVSHAGWIPSNFSGLMVVSIPRSADEDVEVFATSSVLEGKELLDALKRGE